MSDDIVDVKASFKKHGDEVISVGGTVKVRYKPPRKGEKFGGMWIAEDSVADEEGYIIEGLGGNWFEACLNWIQNKAIDEQER